MLPYNFLDSYSLAYKNIHPSISVYTMLRCIPPYFTTEHLHSELSCAKSMSLTDLNGMNPKNLKAYLILVAD